MSVTKEYKDYIMDKLQCLNNSISSRPMMGGYLFYYNNILFGGIYENDNFLIKKTDSNKVYALKEELPYKGAKMMYLIENLEDSEMLKNIIIDTCKDLKPKNVKKNK